MYYNIQTLVPNRNWDTYQAGLPFVSSIKPNQIENLVSQNSDLFKHKGYEPTIETGSINKTPIEQSQISPAGSLDSVESLQLSSITNSNSELTNDSDLSNIR